MSKNKKIENQNVNQEVVNNEQILETNEEVVIVDSNIEDKADNNSKTDNASNKNAKVSNKPATNDKNKQSKKKKEKKPNVFHKGTKAIKESASELKKVSWPKFPEVVKQTGVVLAFVIFFTLVLLGFNTLLSLLFDLFTAAI